jgi:hypothetical protein
MSKIATYPSADTPLELSDRLIGTEALRPIPSPIPLATKNFSLGELLHLFSTNFPTPSLQQVLNVGNIATQNITLIGNIDATLIKTDNIEDSLGNQGTVYQFLSKGLLGINWVNLPVDNLQQVLDKGNTATKNIILTGNITLTKVIPGNIQDETSAIGTTGQLLSKTATGIKWINTPILTTPGLNDVLLVGNTATNNINLIGNITATSFIKTGGTSLQYLMADGSVSTGPTITPAALTKTDDTNITLTLGGSPSTALLQGVSLTLGWTGTLADSRITNAGFWNQAYLNRITSLTTTGSGAATLAANVLNIPTPPTAVFTSLTVTGSSGASTLSSGVLNVPTYTLAGLGGIGLTALSSSATGLTYTNTTGVFSLTSGYLIPTTASYNNTNWDTAYTDRNKWDGGATGLTASTGRASLGANTVGSNLFTLVNPSAITFIRVNADNSISTLDASSFRTAIGAGVGTVTSVTATAPVASTGGTTPVISMPAATASVDGYLTSSNFNTFNNKQSADIRTGNYAFSNDFFSPVLPTGYFQSGLISSGQIRAQASTANHPGILYFRNTGILNSGAWISTTNTPVATSAGMMVVGAGYKFELLFQLQYLATSGATMRFGFYDGPASSVDATNGVYFEFVGGATTDTIVGKTASASTRSSTSAYTFTSHPIAAVLTNSYWFRAIITCTSTSLITFELYDNSNTQVFSQTLSANIPTTVLNSSIVFTSSSVTQQDSPILDLVQVTIPTLTR